MHVKKRILVLLTVCFLFLLPLPSHAGNVFKLVKGGDPPQGEETKHVASFEGVSMRRVVGAPPSGTVGKVTIDGKELTLKNNGKITNGMIDTAELGPIRVDFRGMYEAKMFLTADQLQKFEKKK